jgi:peptide/nickel transport system permease protein
MLTYVIRRLLLMIPTLIGIMLFTFLLFRIVTHDPARQYAGKKATPEVLAAVRHKMGTDKPLWLNIPEWRKEGTINSLVDSQFMDVMLFRFRDSMHYQESVWSLFWRKAPISLAIQVPTFIIEIGVTMALAMFCASVRGRWPDRLLTFLSVLGMSLPPLCIYMAAQSWLGADLRMFPVAGWGQGIYMMRYAALPIIVGVIGNIGSGTRFYRTVALDEIYRDYVRTARAKGVNDGDVLLIHVFRNVLIPVITSTVTALPALVLGALFLEMIFQIPGLGQLLTGAIQGNDVPVVMFLVYITSIMYCVALVVTDVCYSLADPTVSLK